MSSTVSGLRDTSATSWVSTTAAPALKGFAADGSGATTAHNLPPISTQSASPTTNNIVDAVRTFISSTTSVLVPTTTTTIPPTTPTTPRLMQSLVIPSIQRIDTTATPVVNMPPSVDSSTISSTLVNVADLSHSLQHFGIVDYIVFVVMLAVCAVIGFYFGFIDKKKKKNRNTEDRRGSEALEYLVGGRKMKVLPVSLSLVASFISGISLLGTSTEIYVYGTQYAFILITLIIAGVISWYVFLPVFCNLQLTSTYEYFEMRFDKGIRLFGSILFTIGTIIWLPIVIFVPALSFNQVTGINIHTITPVVCVVCIFYTTVGGLKAVVWTDVIQTVVMVGAIIFVIIKGTVEVGGLGVVWERNMNSGRLEWPDSTWDPTVRISMLSLFVGGTFYSLQNTACSQVITQRFLCVPGIKEARYCLVLFIAGVCVLSAFCYYNGLLIHATYYDCDPLSTQLAKAKDQLVPLFVMEVLGGIPGLPGVFIAGVFSAALSSLSTGLNSLAAVFLEDYIKPLKKTPLTERQTAIVMRSSVVSIGLLCVSLVYVVEHLGAVVQMSMTLSSIASGPLLSLFMMGFFMPWINGKSAMTGSVISFCLMAFVCTKGRLALAAGELVYPEKPVSTDGCDYNFSPVYDNSTSSTYDGPKTFSDYIFHMSFFYYASVGVMISVVISNLAGAIFGHNEPGSIDKALLAPCIRRFVKESEYVGVKSDEEQLTVIMSEPERSNGFKKVVN